MPAVSRISLRSAAPQRDGANEKGASTELEATASRILLFRDLLGAGEYSGPSDRLPLVPRERETRLRSPSRVDGEGDWRDLPVTRK